MTALPHRNRLYPSGMSAATAAALLLALLAPLVVVAGGCRNDPQKPPAESGTVDVTVGAKPFRLWVATTPDAQAYGLMNRSSLPADRGMLFVFPREQDLSFWMKNTLIPLDIVYLDAGGRVVSIKQGRPLDLTGIPSDGPAQFVIELNAGASAAAGLKPGDRVDLPKAAREPSGL